MKRKQLSILPELSSDIIEDILSRVPLDALFRFRCVCRSWYHLVRDPRFVKMQLNRAIENPKILIGYPYELFFLEFESRDRTSVVNLHPPCEGFILYRCSCNGLVCYSVSGRRGIYLWNPFTGDNKRLPDVPSAAWGHFYLGYSPAMDEYKMVMISPYPEEVWVHTLGTQSWRRIECSVPSPSRINLFCVVCLNGALHWTENNRRKDPKTPNVIFVFDLDDEKFREIMLPDFRNVIRFWMLMTGEHLSVRCYSSGGSCCEIWVMKEYGNEKSWIKKFCQKQTNLVGKLDILGSLKTEEILVVRNNRFVLYHPVDERIRKLPICGTPAPSQVHNYVETLVWPMVDVQRAVSGRMNRGNSRSLS